MNSASVNRLKKVHPLLADRIRVLAENLAKRGIQIEVVQGLRTFKEQDALYTQGRTRPGQRVTNAKGGQSNHNYGVAVDVAPTKNGKIQWDDLGPFAVIGAEARKLGLKWGGDWKKFVDKPHVELPSPSIATMRKLFEKDGLNAVWAQVNSLSPTSKVQSPEDEKDLFELSAPDAASEPGATALGSDTGGASTDDGTQTNAHAAGAVSEPGAKEVKTMTMSTASKTLSFSMIGAAILGFLKTAWETSQQHVIDGGKFALTHLPLTLTVIGLGVLGVWIYNTASKRRDARLKQIIDITADKGKNDVVIT